MIEAVVFDYGGVISSPLFRGIGAFEATSGYPRGSLLRLLFGEVTYVGVEGRAVAESLDDESPADDGRQDHDWHRLERGEIDFATYFVGLRDRAPAILGRDLDVGAYERFMTSSAPGVQWPVVHRIRELKTTGLKLALLTNNIAEFSDHWRATFPVDELFPIVVDSSAVGLRKPDPAIYLLTLEQVGTTPQATVFLDDNADNVRAAHTLGMETVHVGEDPWAAVDELDAILDRRGVSPT
ncbi:MAG TPA: HAD family phosphatase [Acidimicrobiia bacterium]|nr:HAD family phosphatase [Acidimicrobiia bacterium]